MFLSLLYSAMVSYIFSSTFLITKIPPPLKEIQLIVSCYVSVLIFHQLLNPLRFFTFISLGGTSQSLPKNVLYWRQQTDVTKTSYLNVFLYHCFFNIGYRYTYRYVSKHLEGNIKNNFYICIKLAERCPKDRWKLFLRNIFVPRWRIVQFSTFYKIYYYNIKV